MGFYRSRTFRGKEYWYYEERFREGKKVRSRSTYIGPGRRAVTIPSDPIADIQALGRARFAKEMLRTRSAEEIVTERNQRHMWAEFSERIKIRQRESTRQPAKERARDDYMKLKEEVRAEDYIQDQREQRQPIEEPSS